MTDRQFVLTIYPNAKCVLQTRINFNPYYAVCFRDDSGRPIGIAFDFVSRQVAWKKAAEVLREKFVRKLES